VKQLIDGRLMAMEKSSEV